MFCHLYLFIFAPFNKQLIRYSHRHIVYIPSSVPLESPVSHCGLQVCVGIISNLSVSHCGLQSLSVCACLFLTGYGPCLLERLSHSVHQLKPLFALIGSSGDTLLIPGELPTLVCVWPLCIRSSELLGRTLLERYPLVHQTISR